ncbi:hypothetical protein Acr_15g0011490 [Actinidia rufa]|uniref:Reverse transcriptase zinc-binding domain-containing protein n=1 Tax=Actinidia rufa TaxID=165716 RepID=A0A7J0FV42_9ERIC|nr:hypothetical protein Acr_15g0011490 [Actinidia rufa]
MTLPQGSSWTVMKLFKLWDMAQSLIKSVVGNGCDTFSYGLIITPHLGPLYKRFGEGVVRDFRSSDLQAKVSSRICESDWKWPRQSNRAIISIVAHTLPNFKPNVALRGKVVWIPATDGSYFVKSAWKSIRLPRPKVPWLTAWGMGVDPSCVLCHQDVESHEHLFFRCSFSGQILAKVLNRFQVIRSPIGWSEELEWATGNWISSDFGMP